MKQGRKETDRQIDRQAEREKERQTDRQIDKQAEREREREREREVCVCIASAAFLGQKRRDGHAWFCYRQFTKISVCSRTRVNRLVMHGTKWIPSEMRHTTQTDLRHSNGPGDSS